MIPVMPQTIDDAYVVTVGKDHRRRLFYCFVDPSNTFWMLIDSDQRAYRGPDYTPVDHELVLNRIIADWWETQY